MVILNRIYTRTGDQGTTALASGERRPKYDLRISAYGTVDETNACLGLARLRAGEPASAVGAFREALSIREAAGGPEHPWTAEALTDLGRALIAAGQKAEARTTLERAERIRERRLRPGHPAIAETRAALAAVG